MNRVSDAAYYRARLEAELDAGRNAASAEARAAHQALAEQYAELLAAAEGGERPRLRLVETPKANLRPRSRPNR